VVSLLKERRETGWNLANRNPSASRDAVQPPSGNTYELSRPAVSGARNQSLYAYAEDTRRKDTQDKESPRQWMNHDSVIALLSKHNLMKREYL